MARPNKYNLHYFPLDVNFFEDHKVILIEEEYGVKGGYLAVRLLAMVYEQGYYLEWKDKSEVSCAKRVGNGYTGALVLEILKACLVHGLFDKDQFEKNGVLTSAGIQKRWLQVMTSIRRKAEISSSFFVKGSEETLITSEETTLPATFSTQKEKKRNETTEESSTARDGPDLSKSNIFRKPRVPTREDVQHAFIQRGGTPAMADRFYDKYEATGWYLNNSPIVSFTALAAKYIENWNRNEGGSASAPEQKKFVI